MKLCYGHLNEHNEDQAEQVDSKECEECEIDRKLATPEPELESDEK